MSQCKRLMPQAICLASVLLSITFFAPPTHATQLSRKAPSLLFPYDGETATTLPLVLKWKAAPKIAKYTIEINKVPKAYDKEHKTCTETIRLSDDKNTYQSTISHKVAKCQSGFFSFFHEYEWRIAALYPSATLWSEYRSFFYQPDFLVIPNDFDGDGIPNNEEHIISTSCWKKTLFIRPIKVDENGSDTYWAEFIDLFSSSFSQAGVINIPALETAGIEVVVIGCNQDNFPCHNHQEFDEFIYSPSSESLHCDIMDIRLERDGEYCSESPYDVDGHTFFKEGMEIYIDGQTFNDNVWLWDLKGYTFLQVNDYGYYQPYIYPFAIENYFKEGAYNKIKKDEEPNWLDGLNSTIEDRNNCSPMNLDDSESLLEHEEFTESGDDTVEFNKIYYWNNGKIRSIEVSQDHFHRKDVLRRVIIHEIGHALIRNRNHCDNPDCIMSKYTFDWAPKGFGPANSSFNCEHKVGESANPGRRGVIHNTLN